MCTHLYNIGRNSDVLEMFSRMGVPTMKTPYQVSQESDIVITMLPSSAHVSVLLQLLILSTMKLKS